MIKIGRFIALSVGVVAFGLAAGSARAQVPYRTAPPAVNKKAEAQLGHLFGDRARASLDALFGGGVIICGPFLWSNLRHVPGLADKSLPSTIVLGLAENAPKVEAATFKTKEGLTALRDALVAAYPADRSAHIRGLKPSEAALLYAMQPLDPARPHPG